MYDQFYQLHGRPFQLTPDPHYYFESSTHRKALSYLGYGLAQGEGFIVITGEVGAGKTTLVGHVMNSIDPARLTAVKIVSTQVEGDDMLALVAQEFGITDAAAPILPKAQLLKAIENFLHGQARKGLRTLLIVDEAQNLPMSSVEELRMLSNFQLGGQALLQIFLLGQPEFRDVMNAPEMEQLRQRVIATHHLEPMLESEIGPYIEHRLKLVGWEGDPHFTPDAYAAIYQATDGVPRRVNAFMSRVLLLGAVDQLHEIDAQSIEAVVNDMGLTGQQGAGRVADAAAPAPVAPVAPVAAAAPSSAAAGADLAGNARLEELRAELTELRRAIHSAPAGGADPFSPEQQNLIAWVEGLETRIAILESRCDEQEAALRRVLALLVDWVETEEGTVRAA